MRAKLDATVEFADGKGGYSHKRIEASGADTQAIRPELIALRDWLSKIIDETRVRRPRRRRVA